MATNQAGPTGPGAAQGATSAGDEDYATRFSESATLCLLQFESDKTWSKLGAGIMKIIQYIKTGKYVLLMHGKRDKDSDLRLICNQSLTSDLKFLSKEVDNRAWTWVGHDFSDSNHGKKGTFAVKFKSADLAQKFKDVVDDCQRSLKKCSPVACEEKKHSDPETLSVVWSIEENDRRFKIYLFYGRLHKYSFQIICSPAEFYKLMFMFENEMTRDDLKKSFAELSYDLSVVEKVLIDLGSKYMKESAETIRDQIDGVIKNVRETSRIHVLCEKCTIDDEKLIDKCKEISEECRKGIICVHLDKGHVWLVGRNGEDLKKLCMRLEEEGFINKGHTQDISSPEEGKQTIHALADSQSGNMTEMIKQTSTGVLLPGTGLFATSGQKVHGSMYSNFFGSNSGDLIPTMSTKGARSKKGDYSVTVHFISKAYSEEDVIPADFLLCRKWSFIIMSKKILQGFQGSVTQFMSGQLHIYINSSSEMNKSQFDEWKTSFYEEFRKLDFLQIELQGTENDISVLKKELERIGNISETLDWFCDTKQVCSLFIQGPVADIVSMLSSKHEFIDSMDMIEPNTKVKQSYFVLEKMNEASWKLVENFDSIAKAKRNFEAVHFWAVNRQICGIGEAEAVEIVKKFFSEFLFMKGIPHKSIKDFPIHVLEFMKRKSLQLIIDQKVKKHGMWLIDKDNVLHIYGKTEDELKVIEGVLQRFILWKKIPLQRNALPFFGEKLEKMLASCKEQKVLDTEKFSVEIVGVAHSEHLSVLLIYIADVAEEPSFIDFLKELEENVQREIKTMELSYHSYLEEFCMNDIQEVAKNQHVKVDFSNISGKIHIEGPMAGVGFVQEYLRTFSLDHSIIPVPNLQAIMQKVDDLKKRTRASIQIFQCKQANMWLTQTRSVMLYCGQPFDALDKHVSVIPEETENKELYRKQGNIQWEKVNHSSVHLRCPKWQSGDLKDKHLMSDTIEQMIKQMKAYGKTSVLFCLHEFPTWPVDKLVKSIISSTGNLKGHLKIILIDPNEENCKTANETLKVSMNDSYETAVSFVDVWGTEDVRKTISVELDITFFEEIQKMIPPKKIPQLREPPEQTMSFRNASGMEKPKQERPLPDNSQKNEEKGYPAGNEEERSCLVVTFVSRQVDTENIAKITKSVNPRAIIHPYEKENMALIVFENATDAAKVIEQYKKNPEVEIMLDFLPNQAVVGIRAQISSLFLEKFKDRIGLQKGVESSSGVIVEEIPGRKWLLTGSLPQIHLAHNYLHNELTKIKSATEHSIQSQGTGKTPPQSTTVQAADNADTSDISKSRRSQRSFNAESPSTGGSAFMSQRSNVQVLQIPMEEILYEILLFFHSYWSGKECCRQITYENGNLKLIGNKENIEKLESELPALLAEMNRDKLKLQDLVFKDLLRNVEKREQLDVFVKYFENVDSCWLEFAGFSNEKINELKDNLMREIEKEKKAIESRKLSVAEGGTLANEEPKNVQTFYTNESLEIKVYKGSITNLNVDCIVSSNTRKLENFMGVAKAIANAAGPGFTEECKAFVKARGEIEKGFCCTTGPGKLPYRYVIHVVGPIWTAKSNSDVGSILKQSILSILKEATRLGVRSVALPAISAGQNHANKKLCTRIYAEAVCLFSSENPKLKYSTLKEIHFIDREDGMVELIGKGFKEHFESNAVQIKAQVQPSSTGKPPEMRTVFKPFCQVRMMKDGQAQEYNLTEFFKVIIWLGNILEFPQKYAICCGQDSDFKSNSKIAKQFKSQQNVKSQISDIKKNHGSFRTGDVFQVKTKDCMIYYVIIKSFTEKTKNLEEFLSDVKLCVKKVLSKAEESEEKAIAVPLLGTGNIGAQKSRATKAWVEGVFQFLRDTFNKSSHHLREVYFVSSTQEDVVTMASLFNERIDTCKNVHSIVFESFV